MKHLSFWAGGVGQSGYGDICGWGSGGHWDETYVHVPQEEGVGRGHWYNTYVYVCVCDAELFEAWER